MVTVGTEWINSFTSACPQNNLSNRDNAAQGFGSAMKSRGHNWKFDWGNANAWETDFRDQAYGGDDANTDGGVDSVDFAYLATHGGAGSNYFVAAFGTKHANCLWDNRQAKLGNANLEWLVLDTCHSVQLPNPHIIWSQAFQGLHMVLGFTGTAKDRGGRGWDFGRRAGNGAKLSDAWLDEAYSWWYDEYPCVIACGRDKADAENRLYNERITSGYGDIPHNQIGYWKWRWRS